jgi:hypothetical protein
VKSIYNFPDKLYGSSEITLGKSSSFGATNLKLMRDDL